MVIIVASPGTVVYVNNFRDCNAKKNKRKRYRRSCNQHSVYNLLVYFFYQFISLSVSNSMTKQTMFCVYSPWGYHRCYTMKVDAQEDADRQNKKDHLMGHTVIKCEVTIKPNYDNQLWPNPEQPTSTTYQRSRSAHPASPVSNAFAKSTRSASRRCLKAW